MLPHNIESWYWLFSVSGSITLFIVGLSIYTDVKIILNDGD